MLGCCRPLTTHSLRCYSHYHASSISNTTTHSLAAGGSTRHPRGYGRTINARGEGDGGGRRRRYYATVVNDPKDPDPQASKWPEPTPPAKYPSPYQILSQSPDKPYSKTQFYELVKAYHPDRTSQDPSSSPSSSSTKKHDLHDLPPHIRLERYRLIIAAHTILSDPLKRAAYDKLGVGWDGTSDVHRHARPSPQPGDERYADDVMNNATWEDWERWAHRQRHGRDEESTQTPVYVSNLAFVSLIVLLAALGGVGQATRANAFSLGLKEKRDWVHDQTSKDLRRARTGGVWMDMTGRDARVHSFLETREPGWHAREDEIRKLLPEGEVCSSRNMERAGREVRPGVLALPPPSPSSSMQEQVREAPSSAVD